MPFGSGLVKSTDFHGPLAGVRIVDLTAIVLGPVATQILGDLGADVIKVEPPEGDAMRFMGPARSHGMSAVYLSNNRNKRSVVLDLKRPAARAALIRMTNSADVFVHNMRPGAAARLGLSYPDLKGGNPRLVYASASGYRADSAFRDKPAFDDVIQGASGIPDLFVKSGREAQYVPFAGADKITGYILASSIGMALFARERTGRGQEVHVPMLDSIVSFHMHEHFWGAQFDPPLGSFGYSRMATPHRRPFETADGYICVMPVTDAQWKRLLLLLGREDMAADERYAKMENRGANFDTLYGAVRTELKKRGTADWLSLIEASDVPCGPANRLEDLPSSEYFKASGFFEKFEHPTEGAMLTTSVPVSFSNTPGRVRLPAPNLGEHTLSVLAELEYSQREIEEIVGERIDR